MTAQQKILVVSHDPHLADVRKNILEKAGFEVLAAHNFKDVQDACKNKPDLVMIGYSLPPAEKRRVWAEVREKCNILILELHETREPSLMENAFFHQAAAPDDFLSAVKRILNEAIQLDRAAPSPGREPVATLLANNWLGRLQTLTKEGTFYVPPRKKMMSTVQVGTVDPKFRNMLLEQFGGY